MRGLLEEVAAIDGDGLVAGRIRKALYDPARRGLPGAHDTGRLQDWAGYVGEQNQGYVRQEQAPVPIRLEIHPLRNVFEPAASGRVWKGFKVLDGTEVDGRIGVELPAILANADHAA